MITVDAVVRNGIVVSVKWGQVIAMKFTLSDEVEKSAST